MHPAPRTLAQVIIWVELTAAQRTYYRALFEGSIGTLMAGATPKNTPNLRNLAMELRKLCCHPVRHTPLSGHTLFPQRPRPGLPVLQAPRQHPLGPLAVVHPPSPPAHH